MECEMCNSEFWVQINSLIHSLFSEKNQQENEDYQLLKDEQKFQLFQKIIEFKNFFKNLTMDDYVIKKINAKIDSFIAQIDAIGFSHIKESKKSS